MASGGWRTNGNDGNVCTLSKNGRWMAGGTWKGDVFMWDAETHETVWKHKEDTWSIRGVDFSPDLVGVVPHASLYQITANSSHTQ